MNERLARLILAAAREIRECAISGEHPGAAVRATRRAYSAGHWLEPWDYELLASVVGACAFAARVYAGDRRRVRTVLLPCEYRRLRHLVAAAKGCLLECECFAS